MYNSDKLVDCKYSWFNFYSASSLSDSVAPAVRGVGVEPGPAPAVPPAVGPHHGAVGEDGLPPELSARPTGELEEPVGPLVSLYIVSGGAEEGGGEADHCEGDHHQQGPHDDEG